MKDHVHLCEVTAALLASLPGELGVLVQGLLPKHCQRCVCSEAVQMCLRWEQTPKPHDHRAWCQDPCVVTTPGSGVAARLP